jgi:hypothetical protein
MLSQTINLKSIQKTSGLSKSKLQLLGWLNHWLFSLGGGFERVFIFSVTLDTRKNEQQISVSTIET